ncbi:unnamed protein product [Mytilus coruscus]|uniref:C2H2-type domain-containing protein n=1 Tax=Mytilus coruscus TaxID=42192 RepID=A0A6J8C9C6_MYTCO|nr:unnamed protein product [Mytilus coruscus]
MDHHRGKMSRKQECQQCGATFSKRSLLDEHKRILGHQDVYRCLVCEKGFHRKDNLESHESSEFYQCETCKSVFSHPDLLSLHKQNFHNQSDGGVKRKATQDGPPMKRKITKYDDSSDSYTISVVGTQKMPKFNTTSTRYKVAFRELDGRNIQMKLAKELHHNADIPLRRCRIDDIKSFQKVLDGYQIHVVSKEHSNEIIYEGPETENKMYFYLYDNNYDVITKMPAFLGQSYYCTICNKGYDHKERYACNNTSHHCYKIHDVQKEQWKYCEDCNLYSRNNICFDLHKQRINSGQSTCNANFRCNQCCHSVYAKLHKTPQKCGEQYCRVCKDYFPKNHQCYMLPEQTKRDNKICLSQSTHKIDQSTV